MTAHDCTIPALAPHLDVAKEACEASVLFSLATSFPICVLGGFPESSKKKEGFLS